MRKNDKIDDGDIKIDCNDNGYDNDNLDDKYVHESAN